MELALSVRSLVKVFRSGERSRLTSVPALRDVSFDVSRGEIVAVVGRPGSGKSSLLLCLAGLLRGDGGTVSWYGEQITNHHIPAGLTYVPKRAGYYSFLTVREALEYYATLHDLSTRNRAEQVDTALHEVALHPHVSRRLSSLSPVLLQRLALAQALIGAPRAILVDEALSGEGVLFERDIVALLTKLARRGMVIIVAAPNAVEVHRIAARVINLVEGRVVTARHEEHAPLAVQHAFELPSLTNRPPRLVAETNRVRD
ncbi:MAG TPA: ATP-binding cassette domain-containing protein [Gemmatimonadaceae bacterium]|nr:ATP-binding cassette domain-containing protein [Gemmatimonadaceae bacterium]